MTVAAQNLAKRLADLVGASGLSHDDKQLALIAVIYALGNPK